MKIQFTWTSFRNEIIIIPTLAVIYDSWYFTQFSIRIKWGIWETGIRFNLMDKKHYGRFNWKSTRLFR
jgi:hypothetical protein